MKSKNLTITSKNTLSFFVLLSFCALLMILQDNFKLAIIAYLIWTIFLNFLHKNLLLSLVLLFFVSAPFFYPAKTYEFELISADKIAATEYYPEGITSHYGVSISTFAAVGICLYMLIHFISNPNINLRNFLSSCSRYFNSRNFLSLFFFFLFLVFLTLSSTYYSFFQIYSLGMTIEYFKILLFSLSAVFCLLEKRRVKHIFFIACLAIFAFHLGYGFKQLIFDREAISNGQQRILNTYNPPEENVIVTRIPGYVGHSNRYGFHLIMLFLAFYWYFVHTNFKNEVKLIFFLALGFMLLIIQSRTAWLQGTVIAIVLGLEYYKRNRGNMPKLLPPIINKNARYILFSIVIIIAILLLPRLLSSVFFFTEEGGGTLRFTMIREGIDVLHFSPWLGFGAGSVLKAMFEYSPEGYIKNFPFEIHFAPLQIALEAGILGLFSLMICCFLLVRNTLERLMKSFHISLVTLLMFACIAIQYSFQPMVIQNEWYILSLPLFLSLAQKM